MFSPQFQNLVLKRVSHRRERDRWLNVRCWFGRRRWFDIKGWYRKDCFCLRRFASCNHFLGRVPLEQQQRHYNSAGEYDG